MAAPNQLEVIRFGDFLRDKRLVSDEQLLSALAHHWAAQVQGQRTRLGESLVACGILSREIVASQLLQFCDTSIVDVEVRQ